MDLRVRRSSLRRWGIVFAAWSAFGLFAIVNTAWDSTLKGGHPGYPMVIAWAANIWLWALWTGSLFWWARRFPMVRGRWIAHLAVHVALSLGYAAASTGFNILVMRVGSLPGRAGFVTLYVSELITNVMSYGVVVTIAHAVIYVGELAERRRRTLELEHELTRAQLAALEMQLRPHFLFNTLHSVSGLIRDGEPEGAIQMIAGLGDLLRAVLDGSAAQELPLAEELMFAERYLAIEQVRFADRLRVAFEIAPEARDALVPRLLLQPLLENSIRHGVQTHEHGGAVIVRAACLEHTLELEVADSGGRPDASSAHAAGRGIGLQNTRDRLHHLYGAAHRLDILPQATGGTLVRIVVPLRRAAPGAAA
jgi:two-component system, LytTR family, sensor kinase